MFIKTSLCAVAFLAIGCTSSVAPKAETPIRPVAGEPAGETPATDDGPTFDWAAKKIELSTKMQAETATLNELRMLKAICMTMGDTVCRNAAHAKLRALDE